ncbi:hypothetical protein LCGC14_1053550, partial [marine sediment metagenome]
MDVRNKIYFPSDLANKFNVSTKTIHRWRKNGLLTGQTFLHNKRTRIGFSQSSVNKFIVEHPELATRYKCLTWLSDEEEQFIIKRAGEVINEDQTQSVNKVARKIYNECGRSAETIRVLIKDEHTYNQPKPEIEQSIEFVDSPEFYKENAEHILEDDNLFRKMNYLRFKANRNSELTQSLLKQAIQIRNQIVEENLPLVKYCLKYIKYST